MKKIVSLLLLAVMLLVFLPAGTLAYAGGWRFLGVLFLPMLAVGLLLLKKKPLRLWKLSLNPKRPLRRKMPIRLHPVRNPPVQQKRLPKVPLLKQVPRSRNSPRQDLHPLQYHLLLIR